MRTRRMVLFLFVLCAASAIAGCRQKTIILEPSPVPEKQATVPVVLVAPVVAVTEVVVSSPTLTISLNSCPATITFTATVKGTNLTDTTVTWDDLTVPVVSFTKGSNSATLKIDKAETYVVTARSKQDKTKTGTITVIATGACPGTPSPTCPPGQVGTPPNCTTPIPGPTPEPTPVDVCPNISGHQDSIPPGMIRDANGNCVTPPQPVDVCPNIGGVQETIPPGMIRDANGNCVTPPQPVDVCPNIPGNQDTIPPGMIKDGAGNCVTPPEPCTWVVGPQTHQFAASGGNGSVTVSASRSDCAWTSRSNDGWITITAGSSGTGNGTVLFNVAPNSSASTRTGTLTVANQTVTITQAAAVGPACEYTVPPELTQFPSSNTGNGGFTVSASSGCSWTVKADPDAWWVEIKSGAGGSGSSEVIFTVANNTGTTTRTGNLTFTGLGAPSVSRKIKVSQVGR